MTINDLLQKGGEILKHDSQTPDLDSEILLSFVLERDRAYLYTHREEPVKEKLKQKYYSLLERRKNGEPIAYITNTKEFYSLDFYVDKNVLIPRPETEDLVDLAFEEIQRLVKNVKSRAGSVRIVDVGTGSGCIGVTLIHKIIESGLNGKTGFDFYLIDISGKVLNVAKKNYIKLISDVKNVKVNFVKTDLLKGFKNKFDIIASNPPYIPSGKIDFLDRAVKDFEPRVALNGGRGGLVTIKRLINEAVKRLMPEGRFLFELLEEHPETVKLYLEENFPKYKVEFKKDSFGEWRFAVVSR
ncbi:MAG: peptide chain release factor N(5)-glutamine methyltransferase [Patescibacteria group bacterium]|nr:peptide chain release factor N(5)-glutamine methyltransferase [Patescibacteria group bacterium]